MKTKVENIARYGARHYFQAFSQEELEHGITIDEFIEDGWTIEAIEQAAERGQLEINGKIIKQIHSDYASEDFFTFKIIDHEEGYHKVVHGLRRAHIESQTYQFFIEDTEGVFEEKAQFDGNIELVGSTSVCNSDKIIASFDMVPLEPIKTVYEKVQIYGGAEEGGWYYHKTYARQVLDKDEFFESHSNSYGEGEFAQEEFFYGQYQNIANRHYC